MNTELQELKNENAVLKEQLENYIPRRRVRRVYKQLRKILEQDLNNENKKYKEILVEFINKIEKEGNAEAGKDIKEAIEHLLSVINLDREENYVD